MRQQHQRHRGSVQPRVVVVFPHRPAAAVVRIATDIGHRVDNRLVLAVVRAALVAIEVVPRPAVGIGILFVRAQRDWIETSDAPCVHLFAILCCKPPTGHFLKDKQFDNEHDERDNRSGRDTHRQPGTIAVSAYAANSSGCEIGNFDDADHHQHQSKQIQKRQQARVPQQPNDWKAVAGDEHHCHQCQAADP